jgi:predicted Fe-S protein YdhL (DUF1289 family)
MSKAAFHLASFILAGAALAAMGQGAETNASGPPLPPHWYQKVSEGVTLQHITPVAYFRGLLGMTPAERDRVLADKSEQERKQVLAKVREYETLPRNVREERLFQTELHWYLLVLLPLDPSQRNTAFRDISPLYHAMLLHQLSEWDELPAETRKALLEKESFLRTYVNWQGHSPEAQAEVLSRLPAEQRARWAEELKRWQRMPESRRAELCGAFRQFFYLTSEERKETISALSETERRQMEQSLQTYATMPPAVQRQCLDSFSKFAQMSAEERNQFLENAAKWESMTPRERQLWRDLVNSLPPMPPGYWQQRMPPMPPGWSPPPPAADPASSSQADTAKAAR